MGCSTRNGHIGAQGALSPAPGADGPRFGEEPTPYDTSAAQDSRRSGRNQVRFISTDEAQQLLNIESNTATTARTA